MLYDLTVILPIYNQEKVLRRSLESIVNQTHLSSCKLRVLCVDDGSTDNSATIIQKYIETYPFIEYHYKPNGGVSDTRNFGLKLVQDSLYITFLDPDDSWELHFLESIIEELHKSFHDMIAFNINLVGNNSSVAKYLEVNKDYSENDIKGFMLSKQAAWARIYKSEQYVDLEFPKGIRYEDLALTPYMTSQCQSIVYIKKGIYNYYIDNEGSIMNSNGQAKKNNDIYKALDNLFNLFGDKKELYREELHYLALEHLCVGHFYRLFKSQDAKVEDFKEIVHYMRKHFGSNWCDNIYIKRGVQKNNINSFLAYIVPFFLWLLDKEILFFLLKLVKK